MKFWNWLRKKFSFVTATTQKFGAVALILLLLAGTMPVVTTTGCSTNELKADATTLAAALNNLAGAIQGVDPTVAANLETAATALTNAANGAGSGPAWEQVLNAAAAGAEAIMAAIPVTAPYAMLLSIAVAAAEVIIANTMSSSQVKAARVANAGNLIWYMRTGKPLIKHRLGRSRADDMKAAWNAAAAGTMYAAAVLK
jgi:outer membrane murein-binding lipoprotein Lpp